MTKNDIKYAKTFESRKFVNTDKAREQYYNLLEENIRAGLAVPDVAALHTVEACETFIMEHPRKEAFK